MDMTFRSFPVFAGFAAAFLSVSFVAAQDVSPSSSPPALTPSGAQNGGGENRPWDANLPPELRARVKAAKDKALQDPQLQKLRDEAQQKMAAYWSALKEGILKADPGLKDEFQKLKGEHPAWQRPMRKDNGASGMANLGDSEKQQLANAHRVAENDPSVIAAKTKMDATSDPSQHRAAEETYHQAMHTAMLKVDPSLQPILEKLRSGKHPPMPSPAASPAN
jgi:hypothetical protein